MKSQVAVYSIDGPKDFDQFAEIGLHAPHTVAIDLDLISVVEVEGTGMPPAERAARAWIEAVGRGRKEQMLAFNVLSWIAEEQVSVPTIIATLREAPAAFPGLSGFVYDNAVESWFICIISENFPEQESSALPANARHRRAGEWPSAPVFALLQSLWEPTLN